MYFMSSTITTIHLRLPLFAISYASNRRATHCLTWQFWLEHQSASGRRHIAGHGGNIGSGVWMGDVMLGSMGGNEATGCPTMVNFAFGLILQGADPQLRVAIPCPLSLLTRRRLQDSQALCFGPCVSPASCISCPGPEIVA